MWIVVLILTFLFASLHQTFVSCPRDFIINADNIRATIMIWVTFYLGIRPDCQDSLREEISTILGAREINFAGPMVEMQTINDAVKTDSFIREVLRMKGDIVNLLRAPVRDIEFGGYIIPKGSSYQL
jgi:Cytochrome P450